MLMRLFCHSAQTGGGLVVATFMAVGDTRPKTFTGAGSKKESEDKNQTIDPDTVLVAPSISVRSDRDLRQAFHQCMTKIPVRSKRCSIKAAGSSQCSEQIFCLFLAH